MFSQRLLFFTVFVLSCVFGQATEFKFPEKLPAHPRLFLTKQREAEIKQLMKSDEFLARLVDKLIAKADKAKKETPTDYRIPDGKRLLGQSRRSLERTSVLAFAYRMTDKKEYADVAIEEMLTVCRFKDWNPSHYLDTAEMAAAVGIGLDWLYDVIPAKDRDEIRAAIVKHALNTGLPLYEKNSWWAKGNNNWNEVCNAGLTIGALAIADDERQLAEKIVGFAIQSLPNGLSAYKPDGAYPEGPIYWGYGASFTGLMLKVLDDVFHDDFGLLKAEGLSVTGDYFMGIIGPNYLSFNYADGGETSDSSPMMFALSTFYQRPDYAVWIRDFLERKDRYASGRLAVFHAIWYNPAGTATDFAKTPLAKSWRGIQDVCTMRTAWGDPNAAFLGFKAGNNRANHGHLDIGSFVYEVDGIRWSVDLGTDDYNLPGYFGKQRWEYFRLNTRSHSTLLIDDKNQDPKADCKIIDFETGKDGAIARAVADITAAYAGQVKSAKRTATLRNDGSVVIEDSLDGVIGEVRWGMMTQAKSVGAPGKNSLTLEQGKKKLRVDVSSKELRRLEILPATPPTEKERQNKGCSIVAAFAEPTDGKVNFRVVLTPAE